MTESTNAGTTLPRRALGATGLSVSLLGLGLVKIGRNTGVKYPEHFELPSDAQVIELLQEAHRLGINLLDTAPAYGRSELRLGQALQTLPELREKFLISTKVGEHYDRTTGESKFDFSPSALKRSIEQSLQNLQRSKLDLVLLHSSGDDEAVLTEHHPLATLQQLQYEGIIGACGFSGKTLSGGRMALDLGAEVLMVTVNESERSELPLLTEAEHCGAGVLIKKPVASGHGSPAGLVKTAALSGVSSLVVGTVNPAHLRANATLLASSC